MTKYLLDTDICIFLLRKKNSIAEKIASVGTENCFVSTVTIGELIYGAHNSSSFEKHKHDADKIMGIVEVLPIFESLDVYGREKARLRRAGNLIPELDLLIATTAVHHGMTLVTNNTKHMSRIDGIKLENWTKAEDNEFVK